MGNQKGKHYHLAGVAGVGMSALAQALLAEGHRVSGSDRYLDQGHELETIRQLRRAGVEFYPQDGSGVTAGAEALVFSTAIEDDNPDMAAARRGGVPARHRSEVLAELLRGKRCIAVTGTSGKSTVTGMLGWVLEQLGCDPMVVNGAVVLDWVREDRVGNVREGRSDLWVIEADESDRSLLNYAPDWAIITNASRDHFGAEETLALFESFRKRVSRECVGLFEDPPLTAGFEPALSADGSDFVYAGVSFHVPLPGRHNAENALHVVALCERCGHDLAAVSRALAGFGGLHRRLERVGTARGVAVVDDYAHNPAKIRAAWTALAPHCRRLHVVWRPHGFGPLASMVGELAEMFAELYRPADSLVILPVYDAGGTADRRVGSDALVDRLVRGGTPVILADDADAVPALLAGRTGQGDVILSMGARDPDLPALARRILQAVRDG